MGTQIARLKNAEVQAGNTASAADVAAELNQLVNNDNSQDTRITAIEDEAVSLTGVKTFTSNPKTNGIDERNSNTGVTLDGVLCKDSAVKVAVQGADIASVDTGTDTITTSADHGLSDAQPIKFVTDNTLPSPLSASTTYYAKIPSASTDTLQVYTDAGLSSLVNITTSGTGSHSIASDPVGVADGTFWYNVADNEFKGRINGADASFTTSSVGWPSGYINGSALEYGSSTQVVIPAGFKCRDDSNSVNINATSDITIDITTSTGSAVVNALMNGLTESNSQWYYVWAIAKAGGVDPAGILTTSSSTVTTYPTDYAYKRLVGAVRNDGSGDFIPFIQVGREVTYSVATSYWTGSTETVGTTNVVNAGTSASFVNVDSSSFMPAISEQALVLHHGSAANTYTQVRKDGESHNGVQLSGSTSSSTKIETVSQVFEYKRQAGSGSVYLDILGYTITEGAF
jgi:hypothetical protein